MNTFRKNIGLIKRGLSKTHLLLGKGYILMSVIRFILYFSTPYIAIHYSGKIITLLSENRPFEEIIKYAVIAAVSTLFFDIITRLLSKLIRQQERLARPKHDAMLSRKALSLDYGKAESGKVAELRAKVQENSRGGKGGIILLSMDFTELISAFISAVIALVMISGIFSSHSDRELTGFLKFADSDYAAVLLCVITVVLITLSVLSENKSVRSRFMHFSSRGKLYAALDYYSEKVLNENESGKDIRIFGEKNLITEELKNRVFKPFVDTENRVFKVQSTYGIARNIIVAVIGGLVYIFVGFKALAGAYGVGKVVEYYGLITKMIDGISNVAHKFGTMKNGLGYLELELEYLDLESDMKNGTKDVNEIDTENAEFEFHNVTFIYPGTQQPALENLSMKIRAGERLAVVGVNGSGKSTMIKLLCRLYDPTEGYITVSGVDIREFDYNEYLRLFSVVFQDFKLLAFSVAENIACSDEYDEEKILECLDAAGIRERVEEMPKKLRQPIYKLYEKDGIDISGGEEQKIAIARALYKEAPFVILDEPTAALDPIAESDIYARFNTMVTDKTAVYISHRLSSCRFCERILVFDGGRIIEEGTHEELTALNGKYNEMWTAQAQYYKS